MPARLRSFLAPCDNGGQKRIMSDLDPFFAHYAEHYMASDVDAVSAMYEAPMLALREGRAIHLADRKAVREHLTELMAAYAGSGAARPTSPRSTSSRWASRACSPPCTGTCAMPAAAS